MKADLHAQVLIVGAGPAGLAAAISLASCGLKVVVVEKSSEIGGWIVCGEAVQSFVLEKLGLVESKAALSKIKMVRITSPNFQSEAVIEGAGYAVDKSLMLKMMALKAAQNGVTLFTNTRFVSVERKGTKVRANFVGKGWVNSVETDVVIGADGGNSKVARVFGLPTPSKSAVRYGISALIASPSIRKDVIEFFVSPEFGKGYAWIFGKDDGLGNIGVITDKGWNSADRLMEKFVSERFRSFSVIRYGKKAVPSGGIKKMVDDNVLLIGDAAALADPLSYAGIWTAVESGFMASKVVSEAFSHGNFSVKFLKKYQDEVRKTLGRRWKLLRTLEGVVEKFSTKDWDNLLRIADNIFGDNRLTDLSPFTVMSTLLKDSAFMSFIARKSGHALVSLVQNVI